MGAIDGRTWLEMLSPKECHDLLAANRVGRLGYITDGRPELVPVNYAVDDPPGERHGIVFRSDPGTKLYAAIGSPVCFEIDGMDFDQKVGWSVLAQGTGTIVRDPGVLSRLERLPLEPWAFGDKSLYLRVVVEQVSGRRIGRVGRPG